MNKRPFNLKPTLSDIIFITVLILALALGSQMLSIDSDLGRHLALGKYILDERIVPTRDLLSHTRAGSPRPPYEWLSQVIFAITYRILKLDGVIVLTALILATGFKLVYKYSSARSKAPTLSLLLTFIAISASTLHWLPRPHIITLLLLVIWIENLERVANNDTKAKLLTFPLIMMLWTNLHGGFIFGILAWFAYFCGWIWDKSQGNAGKQLRNNLLFIGITSLIATIITPDLWHNWDAVLNNRSAFILNRTVETMRPDLTSPSVIPYTVLLILTSVFFILNRQSAKPSHFFLLAGFGIMSLMMARNIPLFVIACTPILSSMVSNYFARSKSFTKINKQFTEHKTPRTLSIWSAIATIATLVYFIIFNFTHEETFYKFNPAIFPEGAASFIQENPQQGNMFNEFNWGGYLQYRLFPDEKVFLDSQSDFYGEDLMRTYDQIISANGDWQAALDSFNVDWAIIPVNSPLAKEITNNTEWQIIYEDTTALIGSKK